MATVSASLKMFDQMTRPLQQMTQALNLTISAMDDMNNAANKDIRIANTLNTAMKVARGASAGLQELANSQEKAKNKQDQVNNSFNHGSSEAGGLMSKVKGLVGAYLGFQTVKKGIDLTIGGGARLEQQLITISGMLGNKDVGKAFFGSLNKYANESVYGLKEFNTITRSFIPFTKNTEKLMGLNKTAEKLAFLDPSQGLEGAGFALKEALGGDFMSLKSRFGFGKADAEILKASKSMDEFINKFNKLLASKGATDKALQEFNQSAIAQMNNLKSNIETSFAQAGESALETLKPLLAKINQGFKNGSFQSFFNGVNQGLSLIVDITLKVIERFQWIGNTVSNNWSIIAPILGGALGAIIALKGATIAYSIVQGVSTGIQTAHATALAVSTGATIAETAAKNGLTVAQWALNSAIIACPLTWIVLGIMMVIFALVAWGIHTNGLKATWLMFTNVLLTAWDILKISAFATVYGIMDMWDSLCFSSYQLSVNIQNALGDMKAGGLMIIQDFVNGAIDLINDLINTVNKIPGVSIETMSRVTFGAKGMAENNAEKITRNRDLAAFRYNKDAANKSRQNNLDNMVNKASSDLLRRKSNIEVAKKTRVNGPKQLGTPKMPNLDAWNKAQGPGTLGMAGGDKDKKLKDANKHLKNIDDKIDISNEHLEMMRDLAEMESVQNFVSLTPTVQVTTGDIKEEADINKIISKIETYMENELVNSAEGVYA